MSKEWPLGSYYKHEAELQFKKSEKKFYEECVAPFRDKHLDFLINVFINKRDKLDLLRCVFDCCEYYLMRPRKELDMFGEDSRIEKMHKLRKVALDYGEYLMTKETLNEDESYFLRKIASCYIMKDDDCV